MPDRFPALRAVVLDATNAREVAEFYRELLGYVYRAGDELPPPGQPDPRGEDWLVLEDRAGEARLAVQDVAELPASTWPDPQVPQQLHLDLTVPDVEELAVQRERALSLGARMLLDRSTDPDEPLYVFADPAGHPFCIFVSPDHPASPRLPRAVSYLLGTAIADDAEAIAFRSEPNGHPGLDIEGETTR